MESPHITKAVGKQLQTRIIEVVLLLKRAGYLCSPLIRRHGSVHILSSIHLCETRILVK